MKKGRKRKPNNGAGSLLEGDAEQGMLLDVPAHPVEKEARQAKRCTAEYLHERDPETYSQVVKMLAANVPIRSIKRDFQLGTDTVMAIRRREWKEVGTLKGIIADTMLHGAAVGAEVAAALVADCDDPVAAAMTTKMLAETSQLMRGQATQIMEHRVISLDATAAAQKLMQEAAEMGLGVEEKTLLGREAVGLVGGGVSGLALDCESAVVEHLDLDNQRPKDSCHTLGHNSVGKDASESVKKSRNFEQGGGGDTPAPDMPNIQSV